MSHANMHREKHLPYRTQWRSYPLDIFASCSSNLPDPFHVDATFVCRLPAEVAKELPATDTFILGHSVIIAKGAKRWIKVELQVVI